MPMDFYCAFGMKERSEGERELRQTSVVCAQRKQTKADIMYAPIQRQQHLNMHAHIERTILLNGFYHLRGAFTEARGKY